MDQLLNWDYYLTNNSNSNFHLDIYQLNEVDTIQNNGTRGKQWSVVTKNASNNFSFLTALLPYSGYDNRIDETAKSSKLGNWEVNNQKSFKSDAETIVSNNNTFILFETSIVENDKISFQLNEKADIIISTKAEITLQNISYKPIAIKSKFWKGEKELSPGGLIDISIKNN